MKIHLPLLAIVFLVPLSSVYAGKGPGEVDIPPVSPLDSEQLTRLRELVETDSEARALAEEARLHAQPLRRSEPQPIAVIHYEGLVNTDPRRLDTVENLKDMANLAWLYRDWQATGNADSESVMRRYISSWAGVYRITGNNVNENKFHPLLCAYSSLRDTFPDTERDSVDAWVKTLGSVHAKALGKSDHLTNRYTKHARIAALCGVILDREEWIDAAFTGIRRFVTQSLRADGTSKDLEQRDSLTYHCSGLKPPLELVMLLGEENRDLYTWESPQNGSLKKSVDFVVPFASGEKQHKEWVNTKVELDRERAKAGLEKYRAGRLFEPPQALSLLERAAYFDPSLMSLVRDLTEGEAQRFPTWQTLLNAAALPQKQ